MSAQIELLGRDLAELTALARALGHPRYRGRQIYEGLYRDWHAGPLEISTLPTELREYLQELDEFGLPEGGPALRLDRRHGALPVART